jgi:amidase
VTELWERDAWELADDVRAGKVKAAELVDTFIARVDKFDPELNAFCYRDDDTARARAAEIDDAVARGDDPGPWAGVPMGVKELASVEGWPETHASVVYADAVAAHDDTEVARLRAAGAVLAGLTTASEHGTVSFTNTPLHGVTRNPWDLSRTPGGSSGGSAAAVAAGLFPACTGGDGGGSIRIPSSCCGLFGIKPSRGRVSPAPFVSGSLGLGTSGPIARTVRDAAALLDVMTGNEPGDVYLAPTPERPFLAEADEPPGRLRIALTTEPPSPVPVDPVCSAAAHAAAALLTELGHDVVEKTPPWRTHEMIEHFVRIWQVGPANAGVDDLSLLEPINRMLAEDARTTPSPAYVASVMALQQLARRVVAFWNDVDLVLTPTLALEPVPIGWTWRDADGDPRRAFANQTLFTPFTPFLNVTGQPAMSVPLHWSDAGLPVGVQLIGRPFGEAVLFRLAAQLEEARPWAQKRPTLAA